MHELMCAAQHAIRSMTDATRFICATTLRYDITTNVNFCQWTVNGDAFEDYFVKFPINGKFPKSLSHVMN